MRKIGYILLFVAFSCIFSTKLSAQLNDGGGIVSASLSRDFGRFASAELEQELRFDNRFTELDRSATSVGFGYTFFRDMLKASAGYDLLYRKEENYYEFRHRFALSLTGEYAYYDFDFKLRTRMQATYRDEDYGDYKFNPKYVWRNKLEVAYNIFGSQWKPYIAGEIFCPTNHQLGFHADEYRLIAGVKYRYSRRVSLNAQVRFDQEIQQANPQNILYVGFGWNYTFK